jgi:hypothetical protein
MMPLCAVNQSIPKMTSIPSDGNIVKSAVNGNPYIMILTPLQASVHL